MLHAYIYYYICHIDDVYKETAYMYMHINICRGACILGHMHVIIFAASITAKCAKMDFNYTNNGSCVMFGLEMKKGNELIPNLHVRE